MAVDLANTTPAGSTISDQGVGTSAPLIQPTDGTYLAVNMFKKKAGIAPNLLGGGTFNPPTSNSLFSGNQARIQLCKTNWDFANKLNTMTSFDPVSLLCGCCTEDTKILERRALSRNVARRTFVLTDQNFVSVTLAATLGMQCLKIIWIKNATLWDLHNYFRYFIWDRDLALPVGSAILIASASHLANVSTAAYGEELALVYMRLRQMFDGTIYIIPCPPMMTDGSNSALLRSLIEIAAWLKHIMLGDNCFLVETTNLVTRLLLKNGVKMATSSPMRLMLPVSLTSSNRSRWDSGGADLPLDVRPLSQEEEGMS